MTRALDSAGSDDAAVAMIGAHTEALRALLGDRCAAALLAEGERALRRYRLTRRLLPAAVAAAAATVAYLSGLEAAAVAGCAHAWTLRRRERGDDVLLVARPIGGLVAAHDHLEAALRRAWPHLPVRALAVPGIRAVVGAVALDPLPGPVRDIATVLCDDPPADSDVTVGQVVDVAYATVA